MESPGAISSGNGMGMMRSSCALAVTLQVYGGGIAGESPFSDELLGVGFSGGAGELVKVGGIINVEPDAGK